MAHRSQNAPDSPINIAELDAWKKALASPRPLLVHLNADTSWLIQLPLPASQRVTDRARFNILIDPWLRGPQSDVASWFSDTMACRGAKRLQHGRAERAPSAG